MPFLLKVILTMQVKRLRNTALVYFLSRRLYILYRRLLAIVHFSLSKYFDENQPILFVNHHFPVKTVKL